VLAELLEVMGALEQLRGSAGEGQVKTQGRSRGPPMPPPGRRQVYNSKLSTSPLEVRMFLLNKIKETMTSTTPGIINVDLSVSVASSALVAP